MKPAFRFFLGAGFLIFAFGRGTFSQQLEEDLKGPAQLQQLQAVQVEAVIGPALKGRRLLNRLWTWLGGSGSDNSEFHRPYGVAWAGDSLVITDPGASRVVRITTDGRLLDANVESFRQPIGVAVCRQGVVVSDTATGQVALLTGELAFSRWIAEGLKRPTGVSCSESFTFVVETGEHRVLVFGKAGERGSFGGRGSGQGEFNFPTSVVVKSGVVWVGDALNFRVQRFDEGAGGFLGSFGTLGDGPGQMPRNKGVAVDRDGRIWVSDAVLDRVSLYNEAGFLLLSLGGSGTAQGRFSFPAGIAAHVDGRVALVDSLNRRVLIFRLSPPSEKLVDLEK